MKTETKLKKKKGYIKMFIPLIGFIASFVIIIAFNSEVKSTIQYLQSSLIARKYMFKMESFGYLDGGKVDSMKQQLTDAGCSNIDITGTTLSKVTFGDDIDLVINYDQTYSEISFNNFNFKVVQKTRRIPLTLSSTAKN